MFHYLNRLNLRSVNFELGWTVMNLRFTLLILEFMNKRWKVLSAIHLQRFSMDKISYLIFWSTLWRPEFSCKPRAFLNRYLNFSSVVIILNLTATLEHGDPIPVSNAVDIFIKLFILWIYILLRLCCLWKVRITLLYWNVLLFIKNLSIFIGLRYHIECLNVNVTLCFITKWDLLDHIFFKQVRVILGWLRN